MKALILNRPKAGKVFEDERKFGLLARILQNGGISANYYPMYNEIQLVNTLAREKIDIAFSADYYLIGKSNTKVNIHSLFEELHLPYIGSSPDVLELVLSKSLLKKVWQENGVKTPFFTLISEDALNIDNLKISLSSKQYPFILKPDREGNSRGLSESCVVNDFEALQKQLLLMLTKYHSILIEQFLGNAPDLQEYTIAMIGNKENRLLMPAQIQLKTPKKIRVITTQDKDEHNTQATPVQDVNMREKLVAFARRAFDSAGVRDYGRCDVLFANNDLNAIEINGQPMIPDKWFEVCCRGAGLDKDQYLNAIFLAGIVRNLQEGNSTLQIPEMMMNLLPKNIITELTAFA